MHARELVQAANALLGMTSALKQSYILYDRERIGTAATETAQACDDRRSRSEEALRDLAEDVDSMADELTAALHFEPQSGKER